MSSNYILIIKEKSTIYSPFCIIEYFIYYKTRLKKQYSIFFIFLYYLTNIYFGNHQQIKDSRATNNK